jgi:hypothetical protein
MAIFDHVPQATRGSNYNVGTMLTEDTNLFCLTQPTDDQANLKKRWKVRRNLSVHHTITLSGGGGGEHDRQAKRKVHRRSQRFNSAKPISRSHYSFTIRKNYEDPVISL